MAKLYLAALIKSVGGIALLANANLANAATDAPGTTHFTSHFFVNQGDRPIDISHLEKAQTLLPGMYPFDLSVNGRPVARVELEIITRNNQSVPCISSSQAQQLNINTAYFARHTDISRRCIDIGAAPDSNVALNSQRMSVDVQVPQIALIKSQGYTDPASWDRGINNVRVNYLTSASKESRDGSDDRSQFFTDVHLGADIHGVHLRSSASYTDATGQKADWQRKETYAYTAIPALRSEVSAGETFLSSNLIDGFAYTGIQLATDRAMLEPQFQGYAPAIRGIAQSHARITIEQNGYTIYEQFVPPGEFVIDDIPSLSNGELTVTITEEDGSQKRFVQPYTQIPNLVRPGFWEYAITAGKYRSEHSNEPYFLNAEVSHGLDNDITVFGGGLASEEYAIHTFGLGFNLGHLGGISVDASRSYFRPDDNHADVDGNSYRFFYAKSLTRSTNLQLLGYRYSTEGFRTFNETVDDASRTVLSQRKSRTEATLTQSLGHYGSFYITGSQERYWTTRGNRNFMVAGYSNNYRELSYSFSFSHNENVNGRRDRTFGISASLPLGGKQRYRPSYLSYQQTHSDAGTDFNAGISGLLPDERFSYNADVGRNHDHITETAARLSFSGQSAGITAGMSHSQHHNLYFAQAGGSVLVHEGGILFGRRLGETAIIADTGGVENVSFRSAGLPVTTNFRGQALIPQVQPYRQHDVSMDFSNLGINMETDKRTLSVTPQRGAIALAQFKVYQTQRVLVRVVDESGKAAPTGSLIMDSEGNPVSTVDGSGYALVNHNRDHGRYALSSSGCSFMIPDTHSNSDRITVIDHLACHTPRGQ